MKKMLIFGLISLCSFYFVGCNHLIETKSDQYVKDGFEFISIGCNIDEIKNIKTGVHYYLIHDNHRGGLSPVYNSDGTIKVTK